MTHTNKFHRTNCCQNWLKYNDNEWKRDLYTLQRKKILVLGHLCKLCILILSNGNQLPPCQFSRVNWLLSVGDSSIWKRDNL